MNEVKSMSPEARAARAAYMRKYRKEHPEQVKKYINNTWERRFREMVEAGLLNEDGTPKKGGEE